MLRTGFLTVLLAASLTGALCIPSAQAMQSDTKSNDTKPNDTKPESTEPENTEPSVVDAAFGLRVGDEVRTQTRWSVQGQGTLRVWGFDVYHASTWRAVDAARPFALQLRYLRAFDADDLIETTREEWQRMKRYQPAHEAWLERCRALWPDVRKGDTLTLVIHADGRSEFFFNGVSRGVIEAEGFGPLFADIWLGEKARFPTLRQQLLAAGGGALAVR